MEMFIDKRIQRFSITMLLIACIMFVLFGYFAYWEGEDIQLKNFEEVGYHYTSFGQRALTDMVNLATVHLNMFINDETVVELATDPYDISLRFRVKKLVEAHQGEIQGFKTFRLLSEHDLDQVFEEQLSEPFDSEFTYVESTFFNQHSLYVGPLLFRDGEYEFILVAPIYSDLGKYLGQAQLLIRPSDSISFLMNDTGFQETGTMVFFSEERKLLSQLGEGYVTPSVEKDFELLVEENQLNTVTARESDNNGYYLYVNPFQFSNKSEAPMYIAFIQTSEELFDFNQHIIRNTLLIIASFIFLFATVVYLYSRHYTKLINRETQMAVEETLHHEVKRQTKVLRKIAETDSLTQLYNHGTVYRILEEEIEFAKMKHEKLLLMMLDVDYFKSVNDQYGHLVGDKVLRGIAEQLLQSIRDVDVAGRYGGEEFIIILKETDQDMGYMVAERIRKGVMATCFSDEEVKVTISIGIAQWRGEKVSELIKRADKKLYESKQNGRNRTSF